MIDKSVCSKLPTSYRGRNLLDDATIAVIGYTNGGIHTILHTSDKRTFIRGISSKLHICGLDMIDKSAWSRLPSPYRGKNLLDDATIAVVGYTDGGIHTIHHTGDKRTFIRENQSKFHICGLDMIDKSAWSKLPSSYRGRNLLDDATIAVVRYTDDGIHTILHTNNKRSFIRESSSKFHICGLDTIYKSAWCRLPTSYQGKNLLDDATIAVVWYTDGGIHTILHTSDKTFIRGSSSKFHICGLDMIDKSACSKLPTSYRERNLLEDATIA